MFPDEIGTYTAGDPRGQPLLMAALKAHILSASAAQWTEAKRQG